MKPRLGFALVVLAMLVASACSSSSHAKAVPAVVTAGPPETVLAIGGSATEGDGVGNRLRDAWPYLVFHDALPLSAVFVNGALDDATVARALALQVPIAKDLAPAITEVWLGADDVLAKTPVPLFSSTLTTLITTLRSDGSRRILVGDLPAAYGPAATAYNQAIHNAVTAARAELVPLASASITLARTDGLAPQPDTASHRVIAAAFETAIRNGK